MPKSAEINVDINGKAAHGTAPYEGLDALYITADYVKRTYADHANMFGAIHRFKDGVGDLTYAPCDIPEERTLIHFGKMESGYARNIVSDYSHLLGTVRAYDEDHFQKIIGILTKNLEEIEKEYHCTTGFSHSDGYPPVINDKVLYDEIRPVLESLEGGYEEMPYFLEKLRKLIVEDSSLEFKINATCLLFQYELFPYLDRGDFPKCTELMNRYKETLYDKEAWLSPIRKSELFLYTTLIHIGNQNYKAAKKYISNAIVDHNIKYLPLMRTIRLVRLIAYYETQEFELIRYESRSITRNLSSPKEQTFKTEHIVLWFLNKSNLPILRKDREAFWEKLYPEIRELYNDKYENQLLRIFDFTAWIESKIRKENLSEVLKQRTNAKEF